MKVKNRDDLNSIRIVNLANCSIFKFRSSKLNIPVKLFESGKSRASACRENETHTDSPRKITAVTDGKCYDVEYNRLIEWPIQ